MEKEKSSVPPLPDDFLADNTSAIDSKEVMAELRRRIQEKQDAGLYEGVPRLALDAPPPLGAKRRFEESIAVLEMYARHDLVGPPIRSHRPSTGWFVVKWKKFVRFWVRRYTDQIFIQQHLFNEEAIALMRDMHREIQALRSQLDSKSDQP